MNLTNLIGYAFAGAVTYSCVKHLAKGGLKEDFKVFKGRSVKDWLEISVGDFLAVSAILACFYLVGFAPKVVQKVLSWSWLDFVSEPSKIGQGSNQMLAGATIPFFGIIFVILLFLNLPRLAEAEEYSFRDGTRDWWHAIPRSLGFGLAHMVVGVPLWLGLALSIPGMWFTKQYFKGGISRSTMAHGLYNMGIASLLFVYLVIDNVSRLRKH